LETLLSNLKQDEILEMVENLLDLVMKRDENISRLLTQIEDLELENTKLKGAAGFEDQKTVEDINTYNFPDKRPDERGGVMLVDDCPVMQRMLKALVIQSGIAVVGEAQDGVEALRIFMNIRPKIAIIDINIPRMNGLELTKRMKELDPEVRIIIVSSNINKATVLTAMSYGAEDFLVKPIKPARIISALHEVLAKSA
jgi:two-component system chemotaxis response regulator CheY